MLSLANICFWPNGYVLSCHRRYVARHSCTHAGRRNFPGSNPVLPSTRERRAPRLEVESILAETNEPLRQTEIKSPLGWRRMETDNHRCPSPPMMAEAEQSHRRGTCRLAQYKAPTLGLTVPAFRDRNWTKIEHGSPSLFLIGCHCSAVQRSFVPRDKSIYC